MAFLVKRRGGSAETREVPGTEKGDKIGDIHVFMKT
jgi:hypothetical protein